MCSRDDEVSSRWCPMCGQEYYGDLGHRNCPGRPSSGGQQDKLPEPEPPCVMQNLGSDMADSEW